MRRFALCAERGVLRQPEDVAGTHDHATPPDQPQAGPAHRRAHTRARDFERGAAPAAAR
jgi:hypothetical protein